MGNWRRLSEGPGQLGPSARPTTATLSLSLSPVTGSSAATAGWPAMGEGSGGRSGSLPMKKEFFQSLEGEVKSMRSRYGLIAIFILLAGLVVSCSRPTAKDQVLKKFSCDSLQGVIHQAGISIDSRVKKEGRGALKINVAEATVVRLSGQIADGRCSRARLPGDVVLFRGQRRILFPGAGHDPQRHDELDTA
jgi:hypothetical protein